MLYIYISVNLLQSNETEIKSVLTLGLTVQLHLEKNQIEFQQMLFGKTCCSRDTFTIIHL